MTTTRSRWGQVMRDRLRPGALTLAMLLAMMLSACAPFAPSAQPSASDLTTPVPRLLGPGVQFGTAVDFGALTRDPHYRALLLQTFSLVEPENALKFYATEPERNVFDFRAADAIVRYARDHRLQVRGHVLVDPSFLPDWLLNGHFTRTELIEILTNHIRVVMGRYRGQIEAWDVVNEAVDDGSSRLRSSIWANVIGPDFITIAFETAHEVDPAAKLFYNDYSIERPGPKSDMVYALVKGLLKQHVPVSGVGFEAHLSLPDRPDPQAVRANVERFGALGMEVAITEMDVEIYHSASPMAERLQQQAGYYRDMAWVCHQVSACKTFNVWGVSDRYSWIMFSTGHWDEPLLFDADFQPKPAYQAVLDGFHPA
jgi:endo-1,4-beta-xylanase